MNCCYWNGEQCMREIVLRETPEPPPEVIATFRYTVRGKVREHHVSAHAGRDNYKTLRDHFLKYLTKEELGTVQLLEIVLRED